MTVLFLLGGLCSTANVKMPCDCAVSAGWNVQLMLRCLVTVLFLLGGMYS